MESEGHSDEQILKQQRQIEKDVIYIYQPTFNVTRSICGYYNLLDSVPNGTHTDLRHDTAGQRSAAN